MKPTSERIPSLVPPSQHRAGQSTRPRSLPARDALQDFAGVSTGQTLDLLGKRHHLAVSGPATEPAHQQSQVRRPAADRGVFQQPVIPGVHTSSDRPAARGIPHQHSRFEPRSAPTDRLPPPRRPDATKRYASVREPDRWLTSTTSSPSAAIYPPDQAGRVPADRGLTLVLSRSAPHGARSGRGLHPVSSQRGEDRCGFTPGARGE